jgi:hypothetical protein
VIISHDDLIIGAWIDVQINYAFNRGTPNFCAQIFQAPIFQAPNYRNQSGAPR